MTLRSLSLLVLAILAGTAASVRWYLQADPIQAYPPSLARPAPELEHAPLPMRAEPARPTAHLSAPRAVPGVAQVQGTVIQERTSVEAEGRAAPGTGLTSAGSFQPPREVL
jgi:hypothetical protein